MSVVMANLIVKGKDYGIHAFIVPLRENNQLLKPGVIINDCGDKMGIPGVDNGMISFRNVKIPRENLLDKVTQVAPDGTVTSIYKKKGKRFGVQLAALSDGRVKIGIATLSQSLLACSIAFRYTAVRRQFGAEKYDEQVLLNYPDVQNRIIPIYSKSVINYFAAIQIANVWATKYKDIFDPNNRAVEEMHALISIIKPLSSWIQIQASNEARAVCGGLGYSSYSRIGNLHSDLHINATWEGDNTVLLQQSAKFLLKGLGRLAKGKPAGFETLYYLTIGDLSERNISASSIADFRNLDTIQALMELIAAKSAQEGAMAVQLNMATEDAFNSWNKSLPFDLNNASKMYGELYCHNIARKEILNCSVVKNKNFLTNLLLIKGLTIA